MKLITHIFIFVTISVKCGYGGSLLDLITGAEKELGSKVQDVANTAHSVIGGLTQGFGLNFGGHFGSNNRQPPARPPQETVIVVVQNQDGDQPQNPNYGNPYNRPPPGHNGPHYGNGNQRPYMNNGHNVPNTNYPPYGRPNNNPGYQNGNNYNNQNQNYQRPDSNQQNQNGIGNQYNYNKPNNHPSVTENYPVEKNTENDKPKTEATTTTTKKPDDDEPFFVPLKPNEYVYGGDDINAPKRNTDNNKPTKEVEENYDIDIRFRDQ